VRYQRFICTLKSTLLSIGLNTSLCEGSHIYRRESRNYNAEYQQLQKVINLIRQLYQPNKETIINLIKQPNQPNKATIITK
jgi:hypothetical protein